jgi:hypothetical protein
MGKNKSKILRGSIAYSAPYRYSDKNTCRITYLNRIMLAKKLFKIEFAITMGSLSPWRYAF